MVWVIKIVNRRFGTLSNNKLVTKKIGRGREVERK